jgi:hypothetical protein
MALHGNLLLVYSEQMSAHPHNLIMKAEDASETLVCFYCTTQSHIPLESNLLHKYLKYVCDVCLIIKHCVLFCV